MIKVKKKSSVHHIVSNQAFLSFHLLDFFRHFTCKLCFQFSGPKMRH